jgi:sugar phosphate isomerase/epimerase
MNTTRRQFCVSVAAATGCSGLTAAAEPFRLRYALASCMYGTLDLSVVLPEVRKIGADAIDLWPLRHGNQREQVEAMGHEEFTSMLQEHGVKLGVITRYDLGPFKLAQEIGVLKKLGGSVIVTGGEGPINLKGDALKTAVKQFAEKMKPHLALAQDKGIEIAIENHAHNLIGSPDSLKWLVQFAPSEGLGVALAPYHLEQDAAALARLIEQLGDRLAVFYAWQHGEGCMTPLPKERELLQLPGRGPLDFTAPLAALRKINFKGYTEVFMHPVPRGVPILDSAELVTHEINRARGYLDDLLEKARS